MKLLLLLTACFIALPALAQLDQDLVQQAENWKSGEPPPRLLKFPDGKINRDWVCGMRATGSEVGDYISQLHNLNLLAALLLDGHAEPETINAAAAQLVTLKGPDHVARLLAGQPAGTLRPELAMLAELLRSPYAAVQVACITKDDMEPAQAEAALTEMRHDLETGASWADAYEKISDEHPDLNDRAKNPASVRTLVGYVYAGVVAPTGFDITRRMFAAALPAEHLRQVFRARLRTSILKTADGVYLYYVKSYYDAAP